MSNSTIERRDFLKLGTAGLATVAGCATVAAESKPVAPAPVPTPEPTVPRPSAPQPPGESGAEELPQAAPPPAGPARPLGARKPGGAVGDSATEEEILRYREALRARTICGYCSTANPPGSKYCKECGERLKAEDARQGRA